MRRLGDLKVSTNQGTYYRPQIILCIVEALMVGELDGRLAMPEMEAKRTSGLLRWRYGDFQLSSPDCCA